MASNIISVTSMVGHHHMSFYHIHIISQLPLLQAGVSAVGASLASVDDFFFRNDNLDFMLLLLLGSLEVEPLLDI